MASHVGTVDVSSCSGTYAQLECGGTAGPGSLCPDAARRVIQDVFTALAGLTLGTLSFRPAYPRIETTGRRDCKEGTRFRRVPE